MGRRIRGLLDRFLGQRRLEAAGAAVTDADLLHRYTARGDQDAFELLVWRHGGMVLGLCRRLIRDEHLAEDAFQAVFLVLARKGKAIRGGNIAGWLYRVAHRTAISADSHRDRFQQLPEMAAEPTATRLERDELSRILDAEVARLPARLRLPVLLCYLEGRSTDDVAQELGCPRGTVLSRLSAARKLLAARLSRRGLVLPAALTVAGWETSHRLVAAATTAALQFRAATSPVDSPSILAEGVIRTMTHNKLMAAASVMAAAGLVCGVGWAATRFENRERSTQPKDATNLLPMKATDSPVRNEQPVQKEKDEFNELLGVANGDPVFLAAMKPDINDSPLRKLQKELCREQAAALTKMHSTINMGRYDVEDFHNLLKLLASLMENLHVVVDRPADKMRCLELRVKAFQQFEKFIALRVEVGSDPSQQLNLAAAERIKAEIDVLTFKEAMAKAKK